MERRDFLKAALVGLFTVTSAPFNSFSLKDHSFPDLVIANGYPPSRLVGAAISALGGMRRFISRGDVVVIKPNIAWDRKPEMAANTNPEVVKEIVRLCYDAGAKVVKVLDRSVNDPRRCYIQSGIEKAALDAGAKVIYPDDKKFKKVNINGNFLKSWEVWTEVLEADKIINVPVAKHHSLAKLTMAIKNWMGILGGFRGLLHQRLDECLVDIAAFVRPTLTVLDATRILVRGGPQGGSLENVVQKNTIVAGLDQVAVDAFGATLFGIKPEAVNYIKRAAERHLGRIDIDKMRLKKLNIW